MMMILVKSGVIYTMMMIQILLSILYLKTMVLFREKPVNLLTVFRTQKQKTQHVQKVSGLTVMRD